MTDFAANYRRLVLLAALTGICTGGSGCLGGAGRPVNATFSGLVTKVHDGDSLHITPAGEQRVVIRLAAIDAPEINQRHGIASRDYLRDMVMSKQVTAHCNKVDKYRRQICVVLKDGRDTNLEMLKAGHAWYYERFREEQSKRDQRTYRRAASKAREQKSGLWRDNTAIAPWDFRSRDS